MGGPIRAFVEPSPQATAAVPAQTSVGAAAGIILILNQKRKGFWVQNTGLTVLYLALGEVSPTVTAYHVALAACTGADDGKGGAYFDSNWIGTVRAISSAAGGTCVVAEVVTGAPDWNQSGDWGIR
jgi:hypothetical protein